MCDPIFTVRSLHRAVPPRALPMRTRADPDGDVNAGMSLGVGIDNTTPWPTRRIRSCLTSRPYEFAPPR